MKTLELNGKMVCLVTLSPTSAFHKIDKEGNLSYDPDYGSPIGTWRTIELPSGNWSILGWSDEITEEQARG